MNGFYDKHLKPYLEDDVTVIIALFLFAFILRLSFLPHLIFDPAFVHPVVDCKEHNDLAFELLNITHWRIDKFWYHTPGYAYFVAVIYKFLGHSVVRLAIVQYALGSLAAALVFYMAKRLISRWAGIVAGLLMSVYWMFIYTQSHVYSENLSMLLNLLVVYFLVFSVDTWRKYLLSGLLMGASVVVRPEMLPFAGVLWLWLLVKKFTVKDIIKYYGLFVIGVAFCVLPLLMRHHQLSGNFMLREQIGVNFYMGSMPQYRGSNIYVTIGSQWAEVISKPYVDQNIYDRALSEKEMNAFYIRSVLNHIKNDPMSWTKFMAAKFFSILVGIDFLRTEDVYFYDAYIRTTAFSLIQTWTICILALWGIFIAIKREAAKFLLLILFLASYVPALFFTYKTRYLVSLMPLLIILASLALSALAVQMQRGQWKKVAAGMLVMVAFYVGVRWNPLEIHWPSKSEMYYVIGVNFEYFGDYEKAMEYFSRAVDEDPNNVSAINDLGVVYMQTGQYERAAGNFQRALQLKDSSRYRSNYLQALELHKSGGTYDLLDYFPAEFKQYIKLYHHYFPYPYQGPVYHRPSGENYLISK